MDESKWNDEVLAEAATYADSGVTRTPKTKLWEFIKYFTISMAILCPTTAIIGYFEISNIVTFYIGALAGAAFILYSQNKMYENDYDKRAQDITTKFYLEKTKWE